MIASLTLILLLLVDARAGENYFLTVEPDGAESAFVLCPLSAEHPHVSLDVPLEGEVELVLVPTGAVTNKQVTAHLVGQRVGAEGNDSEDTSEPGIEERSEDSTAIESRKRARLDSIGGAPHEEDEEQEEEKGEADDSTGEKSRVSDDAMEDILEPQTGMSCIIQHALSFLYCCTSHI